VSQERHTDDLFRFSYRVFKIEYIVFKLFLLALSLFGLYKLAQQEFDLKPPRAPTESSQPKTVRINSP
jgi:hypothetical protein